MYISAASMTARPGKAAALGEHVAGMRGVLAAVTGLEVSAWAALQGAPMGSFAISLRHDSMADLVDATVKLGGDPDYRLHGEAMGDLTMGPAERHSNQIVAASGDGGPRPFVSVTTAEISGSPTEAMAWAVSMQELTKDVTGLDGQVALATAGNFMTVTWFLGYESGAQIDDATAAIAGDERWAARMEEATGLFTTGSAQRMLLAQMP